MGIVSTPDLRAASALFSNNNALLLARLYPERRDNQSIFVLHMDQAMKAVWAFRSGIDRDRRDSDEEAQRESPANIPSGHRSLVLAAPFVPSTIVLLFSFETCPPKK